MAGMTAVLAAGTVAALGQAATYDLPSDPELGERFVAQQVGKGIVLGREPGTKNFVPITDPRAIEKGWELNTCKGAVKLTQELDETTGRTSSATFYSGRFIVSQAKLKNAPTTLTLTGTVPCVRSAPGARAAKSKKRSKILGRLWADGKGRFRTKGRFASATVRGTKWLTEDRTDGTLIRVARGVVDVTDLRTGKVRSVKAGHQLLVRK